MIRTITLAMALAFAAPAFAQEIQEKKVHNDHHMAKEAMENHEAHDHAGHDHKHETRGSGDEIVTEVVVLVQTPEITAALAAGGEPVVVDVLGAVCDFCAKAMNKTFGKRAEIAASYVDLDMKTLNLVFKPEQTLDDEAIRKLIKKAGYRAAAIRRADAALTGVIDEVDPS